MMKKLNSHFYIKLFVNTLFILLLFDTSEVTAQGWELKYNDEIEMSAQDVIETAENYYVLCQATLGEIEKQTQILVFNLNGDIQSKIEIPGPMGRESALSFVRLSDGSFVISGFIVESMLAWGNQLAFVMKVDSAGTLLWHQIIPTNYDSNVYDNFSKIILTSDNGFVAVGNKHFGNPVGTSWYNGHIIKLDQDGNEEWYSDFSTFYLEFNDVIETNDGNYVVAGEDSNYQFIQKIDQQGASIWQYTHPIYNRSRATNLVETADQHLLVAAAFRDYQTTTSELWNISLSKISPDGSQIVDTTFFSQLNYSEEPTGLVKTLDGGFALTGTETELPWSSSANNTRGILIKTDSNGEEIWRKRYGAETGFFESSFNQLKATSDGGYIMCGFDNEYDNQAYVVKTDAEGWTRDRFISGTVFFDQDNDCLQNTAEIGIENWIVTAQGAGKTFTTSTNEAGQYLIEVDSGNYNVTLSFPSTYWEACENPISTQVSMAQDTAFIDFPLSGIQDCPYLTVDIGTSFLLWCEENTYTVSYCNLGTAIANGAEVEVTLDDDLTFLNASVPIISQNGLTFLFDIGDVNVNECNYFVIEFELSCDEEVIGYTHCTEAQIYPANFCGIVDPIWDESSVQVEGTCQETNIQFTISNIGNGDMSSAANYNIFENEFLFQQGNFMLESNESTTISIPNNGATYRIETDQSAGHPGSNMPSSVVEGCGAGPFDLGNVNLFELNDADNFVDINCTPNVTSNAPFDKLGQPIGYSEDHFIRPNRAIDYRIRFQNNGSPSNSVNKVVVLDQLSPWLDLSTIQLGAASHDYEFRIENNNTLVFEFNDITLHSSTWNVPQSHGFVKFKIFPLEDTPLGTQIFNKAEIYFEEDPVIFSNTTLHTLGENLIEVSIEEIVNDIALLNSVNIRPNPTSESAIFELERPVRNGNFKLINVNGKVVRNRNINTSKFKLDGSDLQKGVYFFQIMEQTKPLFTGKIVIQ